MSVNDLIMFLIGFAAGLGVILIFLWIKSIIDERNTYRFLYYSEKTNRAFENHKKKALDISFHQTENNPKPSTIKDIEKGKGIPPIRRDDE